MPAEQLQTTTMLSPAAVAETVENAMHHKATASFGHMAGAAFMGGFWISLGFLFFITTQTGAQGSAWGLSRLVGGMVFSTGLFLVVTTGADLFTSTCMTPVAVAGRRISTLQMLRHWLIVWVFNFAGAFFLAAMCMLGGLPHNAKGMWGQTVLEAASGKLHHSPFEAFVLGILCNVCVCIAVWVAMSGRTVTDKFFAVIGPVALFVATGFEHSVANMFLIPLAIMVRRSGLVDAAAWPGLDVQHFVLGNLLPVTAGNIVGGALLIGLSHWYLHRER